ncbi:hypothetical protein RBSH_05843 [Rhodopirellula baltica SH28]|uniref:Uncharacterized protein n=1 Tax=Rhodopirellula baltica SH28 TaxID=993517 RepID=K5DZA6_RHOBT|nr:hypothetical protein RBSH_05843 [Rhodopirellula baltica SH28]
MDAIETADKTVLAVQIYDTIACVLFRFDASGTIGQPGDAFAMVGRGGRDIAVDAIETD